MLLSPWIYLGVIHRIHSIHRSQNWERRGETIFLSARRYLQRRGRVSNPDGVGRHSPANHNLCKVGISRCQPRHSFSVGLSAHFIRTNSDRDNRGYIKLVCYWALNNTQEGDHRGLAGFQFRLLLGNVQQLIKLIYILRVNVSTKEWHSLSNFMLITGRSLP